MITLDGQIINRETAAHKYGGDRMAEYLDLLTGVQGNADEETGDVESPIGYLARFGRQLVQTDSLGFVRRERFADVSAAQALFAKLAAEYDAWAGEDD